MTQFIVWCDPSDISRTDVGINLGGKLALFKQFGTFLYDESKAR